MPIEIRCTDPDCKTLLKAPDDSPGKAVKCPKCKTVVKVPEDARPTLDTLGAYELKSKLGEGGMGAVYEAVQTRLGRKVALKVLPKKYTDDEVFLERFYREARSAAALNHPNIIQVYDIDEDAGSHFFSMECVEGESLQDRLNREEKVPVSEALDIVEKVADALAYAHGHSIIHRDIKPDNIMLGTDGRAKLADLGLAKKVDDEDSNITQTGAAMGTPYYMSPEQAEDSARADHRADIYALGITLLHMVTGKRPFTGNSAYAVVIAHTNRPLPKGLDLGTELRPEVDALIQRMSAKEPEDRYQNYDDLMADVREAASSGGAILSLSQEQPEDPDKQIESPSNENREIQKAHTEVDPARKPSSPEGVRGKTAANIRGAPTITEPIRRRPPATLFIVIGAAVLIAGGIWLFSHKPPPARTTKVTTSVPSSVKMRPPVKPKSELLLHLPFDGTSLDVSENEIQVRTQGGQPADDRFGKPGKTFFFKRTDGCLISKPPRLGKEFSVLLWVRYREKATMPWGQVIFQTGNSNSQGLALGLQKNDRTAHAHWSLRSGRKANSESSISMLRDKARVHRWYHLAFTFRDGMYQLFVDGQPGQGKRGKPPAVLQTIAIGNAADTEEMLAFVGKIDDLRVYSRALSAADIKALYQEDGWPKRDAPETVLQKGLVMHLPLDADNKDATGNGYDGRPQGIRPVEDRFGQQSHARHFDGKSVIQQESLPNADREMTYSVWARYGAEELASPWAMAFHRQGDTRNEIALGVHRSSGNQFVWAFVFEFDSDQAKVGIICKSKSRLIPRRWYHLSATFAEGQFQFFLDGDLQASAKGQIPRIKQGITLGAVRGGTRKFGFKGSLDDFRFYERALTQGELRVLYHEGKYRVAPTAGERPGELLKFGNHSYHAFRIPGGLTWDVAQNVCKQMGGHLACIETKEENNFLVSLIKQREQFWIGLSDSQKKGEFKWVNGSPLTFKKWDKDQPDGGTTQQGVTIRQRGFWGDDNIEHGFICEWPEEAELRKDGRTKTLLAPPLDGFESPRGELDSFGNRVLRGKDAETGLPLEIRHQKTGMHFIFVPAGEFQMGSPDHFGFIEEFLEHPRHKVKLSSPFYIGKYEVTQADWLKLSPANPSKFKGERKPVADITFFDASNYAQKANDAADGTLQFSLPTEAQWERACRSGTETYYYFGDEGKETRLNRHAVHKGNSGNKPGDTGTKKPNPWGIYDMYGSVSEWCLDWAENYSEDVALDPRGPKKGQKKIHRGGHWFNEPAKIRSSRRQAYKTSTKQSSLGFRLVANLPRETFERIRRPTSFERVPRELRPTIREYRGHAYLLVPEWGRWQGGLKKSERMGGHLITFADRAENDFAYQLARGYGRMWIGLRRKDNGFEWITGEQPAFYNWGRGQPDNWGKNENVVETHGELDHRFGAPGTWNDAGNDARQHVFITEWDEIPRDWAKLHERIKEWKGHYYLFVPEAMDWSSSVAKCRALGGYIVNIGDAEERDFVARLCGKMSAWTGPADQRQTLEGERYFVCEWDQKPE